MSHLMILNYSMDERSPVLSHQIEVVRKLSVHFERVTVITGSIGHGGCPSNVEVVSTNWFSGKHLKNTFNFIITAIRCLRESKPDVIFSHMTHVQSALLLPISRVLRIPHFLWYAHASSSIILKWDYLLINKIFTSTRGSFPFSGSKIIYLGQAIDEQLFLKSVRDRLPLNFVHYGRFDKSKSIEMIIESANYARMSNPEITLTICGNPSNPESERDASRIILNSQEKIESGWLSFIKAIPRSEIPEWLSQFDVFLHAFQGSLDKTLVESVLAGLTVVTNNSEFISEFGSWRNYSLDEDLSLKTELDAMLNLGRVTRTEVNESRQKVALNSHTESKWIEQLKDILHAAI